MKEIIIVETSQPQQVKKLFEYAHVNYKIYQQKQGSKKSPKVDIFANYGQVIKDKKWGQELKL